MNEDIKEMMPLITTEDMSEDDASYRIAEWKCKCGRIHHADQRIEPFEEIKCEECGKVYTVIYKPFLKEEPDPKKYIVDFYARTGPANLPECKTFDSQEEAEKYAEQHEKAGYRGTIRDGKGDLTSDVIRRF